MYAISRVENPPALKRFSVETYRATTHPTRSALMHDVDWKVGDWKVGDWKVGDVRRLADVAFPIDDPAGAMSSGYFQTTGMVMAPCSMRSLGKITHGIISNMLTRAADVQ